MTNHFATKLAHETDPADVAATLADGAPGFTVLDARSPAAYAAGHVPGALNVPHATIDAACAAALPDGPLVTYCAGPGCNASTKAAAALAAHGRAAREMIGGLEYWAREGHPVEGVDV